MEQQQYFIITFGFSHQVESLKSINNQTNDTKEDNTV